MPRRAFLSTSQGSSRSVRQARSRRRSTALPTSRPCREQTPQAFRFKLLLALHRAGFAGAITDDSVLLETAGHEVRVVKGSEDNVKITHPEDLLRAERALAGILTPRVGTGFDVHAVE